MAVAAIHAIEAITGTENDARCVYLDGFSTMPLLHASESAMLEVWRLPANPASPHALGERAAGAVDRGKRELAALVGSSPTELTFTSGATEANNLVILGGSRDTDRRRVLVSAVEHKSVLEPALSLKAQGFEVDTIPVDNRGVVQLDALDELLDGNCWLVSVMAVNNETGVVQPMREVSERAHRVGALFHCDAAQALGKLPFDVVDLDADYASFSGHKIGGPAGVGALYVAAGAPQPSPLHLGGGQQAGRRPGTEPAALIAGFGAAARFAMLSLKDHCEHRRTLLASFMDELDAHGFNFSPTTDNADTVPGALSFELPGMDAHDLCERLGRDVFLSTGSACTSGQLTSSHVLRAMGLSEERAKSVARIMVNPALSSDDMRWAARRIISAVSAQIAAGRSVQ